MIMCSPNYPISGHQPFTGNTGFSPIVMTVRRQPVRDIKDIVSQPKWDSMTLVHASAKVLLGTFGSQSAQRSAGLCLTISTTTLCDCEATSRHVLCISILIRRSCHSRLFGGGIVRDDTSLTCSISTRRHTRSRRTPLLLLLLR